MKTCFDLAADLFRTPVIATWAIRPPLVSVQVLIVVAVIACILLFWVRSSIELKQQMYARLYGPGTKTARLEWWEADLDPIFKQALSRMAENCARRLKSAPRS